MGHGHHGGERPRRTADLGTEHEARNARLHPRPGPRARHRDSRHEPLPVQRAHEARDRELG